MYFRLLLVFLLIFCVGKMANAYSPYKTTDVQTMIMHEANQQGLSPSLALAIAKVESDFDPYALSHAGARGVMQIMPATAHGEFGVSANKLYDPRINIRLGVRFIKQLIHDYDGRIDIALSHYNGGSAVRDSRGNLRVIPATRAYVNKVLAFERQYRADSKVSIDMSYAQQLALDDFSSSSRSPIAKVQHETITRNADLDNRVSHLQRLRVHNLTRTQDTVSHLRSIHTSSKTQKVRAWESIFD